MTELTVRQARELLAEYASIVASRDARVRIAWTSGVSKAEIHRLTGLARSTIDQILEHEPAHQQRRYSEKPVPV